MPTLQQRQQRYNRRLRRRLRVAALKLYGGKCEHCGFDDERALQFDHVVPVAVAGAKRTSHADVLAGKMAKEELQLLCANCHAIKTRADDGHSELSKNKRYMSEQTGRWVERGKDGSENEKETKLTHRADGKHAFICDQCVEDARKLTRP
jgi:hypothetical protein